MNREWSGVPVLDAALAGIEARLAALLQFLTDDDVIASALILIAFVLTRRLASRLSIAIIRRSVSPAPGGAGGDIAAALARPIGALWVVLGLFIAFELMRSGEGGSLVRLSERIIGTLAILTAYWAIFALVTPLMSRLRPRAEHITASMADWCDKILKAFIVFFALAAVLDQWGVRIGPILTGFGIVGAAIALGAQTFFRNLIAGILILVEQRFQYGDWVRIGSMAEGHIETIGFRSTRIRQFDDTIVQVPNAELSDNAVVNYTQKRRWRIKWIIAVPYSTTVEQLKRIRDETEAYIYASKDFVPHTQASTHVKIDAFGGSSINILVYCFVDTLDWGEWLTIKERLAYKLMDIVLGAGSSFAFPSRSLYVETLPADRPEMFLPPKDGKPRIEPLDPA